MTELPNGDLQLEDGTIIPAAKRQKTEVYSRVVGGGISCHSRKVRKQWGRTSKN